MSACPPPSRPPPSRPPPRLLLSSCPVPDLNGDPVSAVFRAGPQPRSCEVSVPHRTSTAILWVQCSAPDLNRDPVRPVFRAGPQPRSCVFSVPRRTSTAILWVQCSAPDLNRDPVRPVFRAGPQPRNVSERRMSPWSSTCKFNLNFGNVRVKPALSTLVGHCMRGVMSVGQQSWKKQVLLTCVKNPWEVRENPWVCVKSAWKTVNLDALLRSCSRCRPCIRFHM